MELESLEIEGSGNYGNSIQGNAGGTAEIFPGGGDQLQPGSEPVLISVLVLMHPVPPPETVVLSAYAPMETNWHGWDTMELPVVLKRPANMMELESLEIEGSGNY